MKVIKKNNKMKIMTSEAIQCRDIGEIIKKIINFY